jgi:hypothetical protein
MQVNGLTRVQGEIRMGTETFERGLGDPRKHRRKGGYDSEVLFVNERERRAVPRLAAETDRECIEQIISVGPLIDLRLGAASEHLKGGQRQEALPEASNYRISLF